MPKTLLLLFLLLLPAVAAADGPAITMLAAERRLDGGGGDLPLVEPHVAINPGDGSHIVAAAIAASPSRSGRWHCSTFASFDGGETWRRHDLRVDRCIDPWVAFTPDGQVMVNVIEIRREGDGDQRFALLQFTSTDGGRTWTGAEETGRGFEHPIVVHSPSQQAALYRLARRTVETAGRMTHHLHLSRATAAPWRFGEARELAPSDAGLNVTGVAQLTDGAIVASYWETDTQAGGGTMLPRARTSLLTLRGWHASTPTPRLITDRCASGIEKAFPGYPTLVHARSGPHRDSLYQVCIAPGLAGVTLMVSPDGGQSWRAPVAVDRVAGVPARDARTPMIAVNASGALAIAWYEGHQDAARGRCQDLFITASTDAGQTFAPARKINSAPSCPQTAGNGRVAESWHMGGDYSSLASAPDGAFAIVWADSRAERFALRHARFAVTSDDQAAERARTVLSRARTVMGGADAVAAAGGISFTASGTLNKGAEYQGRTPAALSPGAFREVLAVRSTNGPVSYEYREDRYDGTSEAVREIYPGGADRLIVLPATEQVITLRGPDHETGMRKLTRRIPQLLLAEIMRPAASARAIGETATEDHIAATLESGEPVTAAFDKANGTLVRVEFRVDVQGFGDAVVAWQFGAYEALPKVGMFPRQYGVTVAGRPFTEMRIARVAPAAPDEFAPPQGFTTAEPVVSAAETDASARAAVQQLVPGIHRVTRLRTGFHPLFVEFENFVVALDAPAGYRLLNELPPGDVAPGASSAWLSERYIELIKQAVPNKPIRYVVVTHFHNDHLGGVRAFVAEGATVLAAPETAKLVQRHAAAPHTLAPDRLARAPRALQLEVVRGHHVISDGTRRLELIDVGDNPHGSEMLVAHLPVEKFLFVSDLVEPVALERYPLASHAALDRFFVRWLDTAGLTPERVYTMHGAGMATREHLAKLRDTAGAAQAAQTFQVGITGSAPSGQANPTTMMNDPTVRALILSLAEGPVAVDAARQRLAGQPYDLEAFVGAGLGRVAGTNLRLALNYVTAADQRLLTTVTRRFGRELADRLMKRRAELEAAVSGIAKTDEARRAVLFFLVGCMALDWDGLAFTEAAGYRAGATVTGPGFAYTPWMKENAPEISRRGLSWGSHNRAVGAHTFSTFGDHEALPRAALPDLFFSRATTPSSSLADLRRILQAIDDGATTTQRIAAVAQVRGPELTSALALLESIKYVERDQNGGYRLRITVLGENAAPAAARVVAIVREEMAAWHKERAADTERALSSLTALRQGVPFTVIYSEVWHYIFGHANYFLAADGLITDPYADASPFRGFVPVLWATSIDASS